MSRNPSLPQPSAAPAAPSPTTGLWRRAAAALLAAAAGLAADGAAAAPATLFVLDPASAAHASTRALDINDHGNVVGWSGTLASGTDTRQATFWAAGATGHMAQALAGIAGVGGPGVATALNNLDVVVGNQGGYALRWPAPPAPGQAHGQPQNLGSLPAGVDYRPQAINDAGTVVGNYVNCLNAACDSLHYRAWRWDAGNGMQPMGGSFGFETNAMAINAAGDALVGTRNLANEHHFLIVDGGGTTTEVPLAGLVSTTDLSMNDQRAIAGHRLVTDANGPARWDSFVWANGTEFALAALDPALGAQALAINNAGWVVGQSRLGPQDAAATFWAGGLVWNLNSLLSDVDAALWDLTEAVAISDTGWVAGNGMYMAPGSTTAVQRGFALRLNSDFLAGLPPSFGGGGQPVPVPLPGSLSLSLLALAMVGAGRRAWAK